MSAHEPGEVPRHFFIGGAQRCGTTYLYHLLDGQPAIRMARPLRPEPKFFLTEAAATADAVEYRRTWFPAARGGELLGEKSTSYLERADAARRIHAMLPDARFLFLLRDPVERAISNYWFSVEQGVERLPMAEAFAQEESRRQHYDAGRFSVSPFAYVRRGRYVEDLALYRSLFSAANLKLVSFENLIEDVDRELTAILDFLGVEPVASPHRPAIDTNASPRNEPIEESLRLLLASRFVDSNRALADQFDFDISRWQSAS